MIVSFSIPIIFSLKDNPISEVGREAVSAVAKFGTKITYVDNCCILTKHDYAQKEQMFSIT